MSTIESTIEVSDGLDVVRDRLMEQSGLFDSPGSYEAGVEDALQAVAALLDGEA